MQAISMLKSAWRLWRYITKERSEGRLPMMDPLVDPVKPVGAYQLFVRFVIITHPDCKNSKFQQCDTNAMRTTRHIIYFFLYCP